MPDFVKQDDCKIHRVSEFLKMNNGEEYVKLITETFKSPNKDVENFLKQKAVQSTKLSTASSYLVCSKRSFPDVELVGYFTIATKILNLNKSALSKSTEKIVSRFGYYDENSDSYHIPAILIAQLGRNFSEDSSSISGTDLISFALEHVKYIMSLSSGKTVFLECEKKQKLIDFYIANGFSVLDSEVLSKNKKELVQLYRLL